MRRRRPSRDREWALLLPWDLFLMCLVFVPFGVGVAITAALALLVVWLIVRAYNRRS